TCASPSPRSTARRNGGASPHPNPLPQAGEGSRGAGRAELRGLLLDERGDGLPDLALRRPPRPARLALAERAAVGGLAPAAEEAAAGRAGLAAQIRLVRIDGRAPRRAFLFASRHLD